MSLFKNIDALYEYHKDAHRVTVDDDDGSIYFYTKNELDLRCPHTNELIDEFVDIYRPNSHGAIYGYDVCIRSYTTK